MKDNLKSVSSGETPPLPETDTARLDWMEADGGHCLMYYGPGKWQVGDWPVKPTPREAIDAGRLDQEWNTRAPNSGDSQK